MTMADYNTPDTFKRRREMAQALLLQGSSGAPVQHWSQGANRIAQALFGGINMNAVNQEEKSAREQAVQQALAGIKSGGPTPEMLTALGNPMLPPALAQVGSSAVSEALKPKNYGFMTSPDGTIYRTDPKGGSLTKIGDAHRPPTWGVVEEDPFGKKNYGWIDPYNKTTSVPGAQPGQPGVPAAAPAPLTVTGPGGEPIPIPAGADPKAFRTEVTKAAADAVTGKKTEVQAKSEKFGNRMELSEMEIRGLEERGTDWSGRASEGSDWFPGVINKPLNAMASDDFKKYRTARDNFITATLRDESGAAIGTQEWVRKERELFPQPGDGKEQIEQKRRLREIEIESMRKAAGPGYKPPKDVVIEFGSGTKPGPATMKGTKKNDAGFTVLKVE